MRKPNKNVMKDILKFATDMTTTITVGVFTTKVVSALTAVMTRKREKVLCCIGGTILSWMITDKAIEYMDKEAEPVIDGIVDIFCEEKVLEGADDDGDNVEQSQK